MIDTTAKWLLRRWTIIHRVALMLLAVFLVYQADRWFEDFRDAVGAGRTPSGSLWRWFVAAGLLTAAGVAAGFAVRSRSPDLHFKLWRAVVIAAVPFLLAMTLPAIVWGWPGSSMGSWFLSVRAPFGFDTSLAGAMWLWVGLAITAGFALVDDPTDTSPTVSM